MLLSRKKISSFRNYLSSNDKSFFHFVEFHIQSDQPYKYSIVLTALLQPPVKSRGRESVEMTRGTRAPRSWKRAERQACTLSSRERGGRQRRQSRESRKVAESRGPSGRDPAGMQRRLELIDRGTRANLSASWRRV